MWTGRMESGSMDCPSISVIRLIGDRGDAVDCSASRCYPSRILIVFL
ncbi:hypothetical protein [[Clostridium] scindens]|nr:hypothetical protein [[Clostridium] scindens]